MIFWQVRTGGDRNFGYLVGDEGTRQAVVIDPSYAPKKFLDIAHMLGLEIMWTIGTHAHSDHTKGMIVIKKATGAQTVKHRSARGSRPDLEVEDGRRFTLGDGCVNLDVIHTPGHTPCSICILVQNKLITGDTLFVGKVGGTRTKNMARKQWESLQRITRLEESIEVYPGHDFGVATCSTIWIERRSNPFLLTNHFEAFFWLKENWESHKLEFGIE